MAKNITSVAILSDWPLALFPELKPGPKIKVKQASPAPASALGPGPLPNVLRLHLNSSDENPHLASGKCMVDISKAAGLLSHLPNLHTLQIRGGHNSLTAAQVHACRPKLGNVTSLFLNAASEPALRDLVLCCNPNKLEDFQFVIPPGNTGKLRNGTDLYGERIVDILTQYGVADTLENLYIDTSHCDLLAFGRGLIRDSFQTVTTLSHFTSLRHLSVSADNIYFPSLYPRVLLRDPNTGDEHNGERLVRLLPCNLESLEIKGVYAVHPTDLVSLAEASVTGGRFEELHKVVLFGDKAFTELTEEEELPYPVPSEEGDAELEDWHELEKRAKDIGPQINSDVRTEFDKAGIDFEFDMPEFYVAFYTADWDDEP